MTSKDQFPPDRPPGHALFIKKNPKPITDQFLKSYSPREQISKSNLLVNPRKEIKSKKENLFQFTEKFIKLNNVNIPLRINYNPNLLTPVQFPRSNGLFLDVAKPQEITADNLPEFAYPLVQFIKQTRPDYIIACDRGGRMLGLAVHLLYQQFYGSLPTRDHSIRFRRISKNVPVKQIDAYLRADVRQMTTEVSNPRILVLDDWISTGATKEIADQVLVGGSDGKAEVFYGVMRGQGADISGNPNSRALPDWHDRPEITGVDYSLNPAGLGRRVRSWEALHYRQRLADSVERFAQNLGVKPMAPRK